MKMTYLCCLAGVLAASTHATAEEVAPFSTTSPEETSVITPVSSATYSASPETVSEPVMAASPATQSLALPEPETPAESLQPCIQRDRSGDFLGWADYPHCLVDFRTQSTVRWLDDWFGQPDVDAKASAAVRAITEMVIDDEGRVTPAFRLRARLNLPKINRRLSLVFEDETQDPNRPRGVPSVNEAAVALRWLVVNLERFLIETDAGVRSGPDLFARARLRKSWALGTNDQIRVSQTVRYGVREKLRAINELDYNHAFSERLAGSLYHNLDHQEEDDARGLFWSRGALASYMLEPDATIAMGAGQEGVSKPSWEALSRFVWFRYRQRFMRDWLFYEVEPRLTQTRERDWDTLPSLALRLEVHFGQHAAQKFRNSRSRAPLMNDSKRAP